MEFNCDTDSTGALTISGTTLDGNKSGCYGGAIYVTSNYSRLYLTGDVTYSNNLAGSTDSFIHLYNSNYTNPSKIYATHSSSAAWYSAVKGNATCIDFDLTTLPYYDKMPLANNPENFQGLGSTTYANINGKTVTAEAFYRLRNESLGDPNNGMGLLIYQCIQYKRAHPEEDVKITFCSYRTSVTAARFPTL